jgi:hypothetical protein
MPGGRPTDDPKGTLVAVRLGDRQLRALEDRCRHEGVGLSEALRRCVDDWASTARTLRTRRPTPEERETFEQAFAALGLKPRRRRR